MELREPSLVGTDLATGGPDGPAWPPCSGWAPSGPTGASSSRSCPYTFFQCLPPSELISGLNHTHCSFCPFLTKLKKLGFSCPTNREGLRSGTRPSSSTRVPWSSAWPRRGTAALWWPTSRAAGRVQGGAKQFSCPRPSPQGLGSCSFLSLSTFLRLPGGTYVLIL